MDIEKKIREEDEGPDEDTENNNNDKNDNVNVRSSVPPKRPVCEMCKLVEHKYTCPGCAIKTCCLACIKSHKEKFGCSGERDKTAFVDMSQYKDLHLLNDYRLLENSERSLYSNKNKMTKTSGTDKYMTKKPYEMTKRSKYLVNAAFKRGVKLRMLPQFLSKNKENTSFFNIQTDCIDWHVEWLFVTPGSVVKVKDQKVAETVKLLDAAEKFVNVVEYPHLKKPLDGFNKTSLPLCQFLLKVEGLPANMPRFFSVNKDLPVSTGLRGHCLTEHPIVHVVPAGHSMDNYVKLSKGDMLHMMKENSRHMTRYFPELSTKEESTSLVLNPQSSVFLPAKTKEEKFAPPKELLNPRQIEKQLLNTSSPIFCVP